MKEFKFKDLDHAARVVEKIARRSQKYVVGVFSPSIIHIEKTEVKEDGLVGSFLFPCNGTITRVAVSVPGVTPKKTANITLELMVENVVTTIGLSLNKETSSTDYSLAVKSGSVLTMRAPAKSSILASMMFVPAVGNYKMEQYLLDNIESAVNEGIRDTLDEGVSSGPTE